MSKKLIQYYKYWATATCGWVKNFKCLSERVILAAKNKDVVDLNFVIQNQIIGTLHSFKSIDCVTTEDEATNYPSEFLNSLDVPGLPPHNLQLKIGSVVMMLQNLNQPKLGNGTHLMMKKTDNKCDSQLSVLATVTISSYLKTWFGNSYGPSNLG